MAWWSGLFNAKNTEYRFDFSAAKRRCRIAVIDDDINALPVDDIKRDDYHLDQYQVVDGDLLRQCEQGVFDIIILDYNGIAPASISPTDGFGIFDRIRKANPRQYIISISANTYDITKTEYFKEANSWLKKPIDLLAAKQKIDDGIRTLFDRNRIVREIEQILRNQGIKEKQIRKVCEFVFENKNEDIHYIEKSIKSISRLTEISSDLWGIIKAVGKISAL